MRKEEEIKILTQIGELLHKLIRGDTYFKDDMIHLAIEEGDIDQMIGNILNDFPIFNSTIIKAKLDRAIDIYKKRLKLQIEIGRDRSFMVKNLLVDVENLSEENKILRQQRNAAITNTLKLIYAHNQFEDENFGKNVLDIFPDDLVIMSKMKLRYPLNEDEVKKVETALTFQT
jgi:hypothetical protein